MRWRGREAKLKFLWASSWNPNQMNLSEVTKPSENQTNPDNSTDNLPARNQHNEIPVSPCVETMQRLLPMNLHFQSDYVGNTSRSLRERECVCLCVFEREWPLNHVVPQHEAKKPFRIGLAWNVQRGILRQNATENASNSESNQLCMCKKINIQAALTKEFKNNRNNNVENNKIHKHWWDVKK